MRIGTPAATQVDPAMLGELGGAQQEGMEGVFAQLLMQLFGNLDSSGEIGETQLPLQAAPEEDGKQVNAAAMQMMAELLAANGMQQPELLLPEDESAAVQLLPGMSLDSGKAAELFTALAAQGMPAAQSAAGSQETLNAADGGKLFAELASGGESALAAPDAGIPVVLESDGSSGGTALFDGQMQFRQSVAAAQKALKEEAKPTGAEPVDIDALQQQVDAERPGMTSALREKTYDFQQRSSVVGQVKKHVLKNLNDGNGEFTVKLKPESLGEITVKLVKNEGKISMSIVTASVETAKLLNESAEALKSSLHPLRAEIREIVPRTEQSSDAQQGGFFGSGFESFQHQQQFTQREQPQYYTGPGHERAGSTEAEEVSETAAVTPDGLDAYI